MRMKREYETNENKRNKRKKNTFSFVSFIFICFVLSLHSHSYTPKSANAKSAAEERAAEIESALYTRAEFFGVQAILPFPTAEARERLAELQQRRSQDPEIVLRLAELDEKLGRNEQAHQEMLRYVSLQKNSLSALVKLAHFHHRRARFAEEAAVRERMITLAPRNERAPILHDLIGLAQRHRLEKYLKPGFFHGLIASDPLAFEIVKQSVELLVEQKDYAEALRVLRQHKISFPGEKNYFIETEVVLLLSLKKDKEAEALYVKSFDPFWSKEQSEHFYHEFLSNRDRLRAYGRELKGAFRLNPGDFDIAVRLFHYLQYEYEMNDATAAKLFIELEKARSARRVKWTTNELATAAQLLIANDQIDLASRYLYTLYQQGGLQRGSELRAKVLYRLFKLLIDAEDNRTPLTAGDLRFYQDIAKADPHPGMLGGVLSLVLADSNPQKEYQREEEIAVAHFNRAAGYRLFNAYKQEYPTSPALAQMYLDLIRLYSTTGDTHLAAELLAEFDKRHSDAPQYPEVALKLADSYIRRGAYEQERAIYQRVLDFLGERRKAGKPLLPVIGAHSIEDLTSNSPTTFGHPQQSNPGTDIDNYSRPAEFRAFPLTASGGKLPDGVSYASILERYVASLAKENRTAEILALYSNEIKKYPDEQGLYEQRLQWLGQTNLVEEQLRVYQEAIKRFPTNLWTDRLARWYLRRERKQDFERFSRGLIGRLNDEEVEAYLYKFINSGVNDKSSAFDQALYLGLYRIAHERFPHNLKFVEGLLRYYHGHKQWEEWRGLMAEYYFESEQIREQYLLYLASHNKLREYLNAARNRATQASATSVTTQALAYKLFRAESAVWLSNYEEAIESYRELNRLYPNTPEFNERLVAFTRSFGQKDQQFLEEAINVQRAMADASPSSDKYRTTAGELYAEIGDYRQASHQWEQLIKLGAGDTETYLNTATVYWDYFQYADATRVIKQLRQQKHDHTLYAFQTAAILEAQHQTRQALSEYVKSLDKNSLDYWGALRRLKILCAHNNIPAQLRVAFQNELVRAKNRDSLVLGYISLLEELQRWPEASSILRREIERSRSQDFIERARDYFKKHEEPSGEVAALRSLIVAAKRERFAISFRLQLAKHAASRGRRDQAAAIIGQLVNKYPTNYGVLSEASDFSWRIGKRDQALGLLANAERRARGRFHYIFGRKLAARQIERGQMRAAEGVLKRLYDENPKNIDVFNELARIYVRTSRPDALRERYRQTIRAIKQSDLDRTEIRDQIEALRGQVIEAFTQLRDYQAAIEQHIEIINRDPDDDEHLASAIRYIKRYGGADELINYYTKTSQQAYKDYRWNLVLSRIYEAKNDLTSAIRELRRSIVNQPEMIELHSELAEVCLKAKDYNAAIDALNRACELSNDDPQYLKRLANALDKAGRSREAEKVRDKLPVDIPRSKTVGEQFADAARMKSNEKAKAIEAYRKAFDSFAGDFYKHELKAHELTGYVETLREEEPLGQILLRLWGVRERIKRDVASRENLLAGKARNLLATFDGALPEAVGRTAAEFATGDELVAIDSYIRQWMNESKGRADADDTHVILFNLSHRAGLGKLAEEILVSRKDNARALDSGQYRGLLMSLISFYSERGAYQRVIELLEHEQAGNRNRDGVGFRTLIAEYARLTGDIDKELQSLRAEYQSRKGDLTTQNDPLIERYFEALLEKGEAGRAELRQCTQKPSPHHFQLIGFLVRNNEMQLAREAIGAAPLSASWKSSRQAELSVIARDLTRENEAHFLRALAWKSIGEMISDKQEVSQHLAGDNWFCLAESYGRWITLSEKSKQKGKVSAAVFLPAMLENRPMDANQQWRLGRWYLEQVELDKALEHLELAAEMNPHNKQIVADIGSTYFRLGKQKHAREVWGRIIEDAIVGTDKRAEAKMEDYQLYLRVVSRHGLASEARAKIRPFVITQVKKLNRTSDGYDQGANDEMESLKPLIHSLVGSFDRLQEDGADKAVALSKSEAEKAVFLQGLCEAVTRDTLLAEMVIHESLVARNQLAPFYQMLVRRNEGLSRYSSDPDFIDRLRTHPTWSATEIEESLDHKDRTQVEEARSGRLDWQKEYLDYLVAERKTNEALKVISDIEKEIKGRYPRPLWLRLSKFRLEVRAGRVEQAFTGLKHLVGIEVSPRIEEISPPKLEWLNQAVEMLRSEKKGYEADELLKAAYARTIALEQFQSPSFIGLARLSFANGQAEEGLSLLKLMVGLGNSETRETSSSRVASLPWVKARAVNAEWIEAPEPSYEIQETEALRLAAETTAEFGHYATAIEYRRGLLRLTPEDNFNRLELARLLAASNKFEDAIKETASLITDRRVQRQVRWTALWSVPEIAAGRDEQWQALKQQLHAAVNKDQEAIAALEILSQFRRQQSNDAITLSVDTAAKIPSPQLSLLPGLIQKSIGQERESLQSFLTSMIALGDTAAVAPFGATEDELRWQIVRLYATLGYPRAALKLAGVDERLKGKGHQELSQSQPLDDDVDRGKKAQSGLLALPARAVTRERRSQLELLSLLSSAAEQIGDLTKAADYERARVGLLLDVTKRRQAESRIEQLKAKQKERFRMKTIVFTIDKSPCECSR